MILMRKIVFDVGSNITFYLCDFKKKRLTKHIFDIINEIKSCVGNITRSALFIKHFGKQANSRLTICYTKDIRGIC